MPHLKKIYDHKSTIISLFTVAWLTISSLNSINVESAVIKRPSVSASSISTIRDWYKVQAKMSTRQTFDQYRKERVSFFQDEQTRALGSKIKLNDREILANEVFQTVKKAEMDNGFANPGKFAPGRHFFRVLEDINNSDMFKLIRKMPKGGVLHAHDTALTSRNYVLSLTYWPDLWFWYNKETDDIGFKFSREKPEDADGLEWKLVANERESRGREEFDEDLKRHFSLYTAHPETEYTNIDEVWRKFIGIFIKITPLLTYVPVWKAYYKQALQEFYEDGVQYLEFRGTLEDLYDLDGNIYRNGEVIDVYVEALKEFRAENPDFIGSKFVYAPSRRVDDDTFNEYMKIIMELKTKYPKFVVGFDIVSQEDTGRPLIDFAEQLLKLPSNINFYFHAGETSWNGMSTDENLIDAVLLGTKRIGHGYAILKHPKVLEAVRNKSIAVELNPISNQVLLLVDNSRNHPGGYLFADDYPVVVSSDDPSFWEATPLSHDFYIAFMGIASAHADLRTLKQLAINSLVYSALDEAEKEIAFKKWQTQWNSYIEWVISQRSQYNL